MISVFISALIFSIWCIILFFDKSIGMSMILFVAPLLTYIIYILNKKEKIANKKALILIVPIILLSATYFIYNNAFFRITNLLAIPILFAYMLYKLFNEKVIFDVKLIKNVALIFLKPFSYIEEAFNNLSRSFEERKYERQYSKDNEKTRKVLKALVITVPIVIVIIILLSSADAIFGDIFKSAFTGFVKMMYKIDILSIIARILLIWLVATYLLLFFYYILKKCKKVEEKDIKQRIPKDNFTMKMILTTLNVVYFIFCIIQIRSLFLGKVDMNFADYARQGFFQLMVVSIINLITILIAKKIANSEDKHSIIFINTMCIFMILFTFIILMSSAYRMYLYENAYGYTLLRLLVYCALFTETLLLFPTVLYVLDKKVNLPKAYFEIIMIVYICMNFANFDSVIAWKNVNRYITTGKIDMYYLKEHTSTDAVPEIIRLLDMNKYEDNTKKMVRGYLDKLIVKESLRDGFDLREFNLSKATAKRILL